MSAKERIPAEEDAEDDAEHDTDDETEDRLLERDEDLFPQRSLGRPMADPDAQLVPDSGRLAKEELVNGAGRGVGAVTADARPQLPGADDEHRQGDPKDEDHDPAARPCAGSDKIEVGPIVN